jgi:hypothetical protein
MRLRRRNADTPRAPVAGDYGQHLFLNKSEDTAPIAGMLAGIACEYVPGRSVLAYQQCSAAGDLKPPLDLDRAADVRRHP